MKQIVKVWIEDFFGEAVFIGHDSIGAAYSFVTNLDKRRLVLYELAVSTFKNGHELFGISTTVFHGGNYETHGEGEEYVPVTRSNDSNQVALYVKDREYLSNFWKHFDEVQAKERKEFEEREVTISKLQFPLHNKKNLSYNWGKKALYRPSGQRAIVIYYPESSLLPFNGVKNQLEAKRDLSVITEYCVIANLAIKEAIAKRKKFVYLK